MQQQVITYNYNMNGRMYDPLKYVDPSGERQIGWVSSYYQTLF